jgi:uncharacterized peroxidase-related enzyme
MIISRIKRRPLPPMTGPSPLAQEERFLDTPGSMPHVPLLKTEKAPQVVKVIYEEFHRRMSFPSAPNFIMTQGHSPTVARGTWEAVRNILVSGEIPRWTKEMMFVAISKDRGCRYCTAAHIACCRMLGVKTETLNQLVEDISKLDDPKARDLILLALKCSRNPQSLTDDDYDNLRGHGLKQSEIVEIIGMSAFAVYANIIADATAMEPDEMFSTI